jgi:hypothetical protein
MLTPRIPGIKGDYTANEMAFSGRINAFNSAPKYARTLESQRQNSIHALRGSRCGININVYTYAPSMLLPYIPGIGNEQFMTEIVASAS